MALLATLTACAGLALLTILYRRDRQRVRRQRADFFSDCTSVLDCPRIEIDTFGYPRLTGTVNGTPIRADVVVDCMALRKLPSLWLRVTLEAPVATGTILDIMMRPSGTEFFSPFGILPDRLDTPAGWPERAVIHTDDPERLPEADTIAPHVSVLEDPKAKELIIAPKGVRLVWQADEARRGDYLLLRQARFEVVRFDPERFRELVGRCIKIRDALKAARGEIRREAAA